MTLTGILQTVSDLMRAMHDDIYLHEAPLRRSRPVPSIIHQFWEGDNKPEFFLTSCADAHKNWTHITWNKALISSQFPDGRLVNDQFMHGALNLLSDVARYEVLMLLGGMYVDADTECIRPVDYLVKESLGINQAMGFYERDANYIDGLLASGVIVTYPWSPLTISLISALKDTDWGQPPWISAGPMHFTKILKKINAKLEGRDYLGILIMPSYHVYPYHHSDKRGPDHMSQIFAKGSVMDQKWGTTHGSYGRSKWKREKTHVKDLDDLLSLYVERVHIPGLSALAKKQVRWVLAKFRNQASLCTRISHLVSSLAFAIATGRVLLFDWRTNDSSEKLYYSDFDDIFDIPISMSFANAVENFGFSDHDIHEMTVNVKSDEQFLRTLRTQDVDRVYMQSIVELERDDWWAVLLIRNRFYRNTVFRGQSSDAIYSRLKKFMFSPKDPVNAFDCNVSESVGSASASVLPSLQNTLDLPEATTACFVYLMAEPTDTSIQRLQRSIASINKNFGGNYPFLLFVDQFQKWQYLQHLVKNRIYVVELDPAVQSTSGVFVIEARDREGLTYPSTFLLGHPSLERFDYAIVMDPDLHATTRWTADPIEGMKNKKFGFWVAFDDAHSEPSLWSNFLEFVRSKQIRVRQPGLVLTADGHYRNTTFCRCFLGAMTSEFRTPQFMAFVEFFDASDGWLHEGKLLAFYVALFMQSADVEFFDYVNIEHGSFHTPLQINIPVVTEDIIAKVFA
mmetsp:Transcript_54564/g.144177  ORF Transcript_54564/g.144177 Transcript_54564/m.144177 type:complete len:737 (+) Transcript_54564:34-2244(+)